MKTTTKFRTIFSQLTIFLVMLGLAITTTGFSAPQMPAENIPSCSAADTNAKRTTAGKDNTKTTPESRTSQLKTAETVHSFGMSNRFELKEEGYINDIPFNTYEIYRDYSIMISPVQEQTSLKQFKLDEEAYVDDIPFNTKEVVKSIDYNDKEFINIFRLEEEAYVNDIPFNTKSVFENLAK